MYPEQTSLLGTGGTVSAEMPGLMGRKRRDAALVIQSADDNEIPADTRAALEQKQLKLHDKVHVLTALVDGRNVKLLETSSDKRIGLQSIDKNKLDGKNLFVASGIRILMAYVTGDSANPAQDADNDLDWFPLNFGSYEPVALYNVAGQVTAIPVGETIPGGATYLGSTSQYERWFPGMTNGQITVIINGSKHLVKDLNLSAFANSDGVFMLDNPRAFTPTQELQVDVDFSGTQFIQPSDDEAYFIRVEFIGSELLARG